MNAIALNDLSLNAEIDAADLSSTVGGLTIPSRWVSLGISTGNFGAWRTYRLVDMGHHTWRGKCWQVTNQYQKRSRVQTERRFRSLWTR